MLVHKLEEFTALSSHYQPAASSELIPDVTRAATEMFYFWIWTSRRDLLDVPGTKLGAEEVRRVLCGKSVHTPCCLPTPAGLTAGPTLPEPVTPAFLALPASSAGPGHQLFWVHCFQQVHVGSATPA